MKNSDFIQDANKEATVQWVCFLLLGLAGIAVEVKLILEINDFTIMEYIVLQIIAVQMMSPFIVLTIRDSIIHYKWKKEQIEKAKPFENNK